MIVPIKPSEIGQAKLKFIPPEVIESFNELISINYTDGRAVVKQDEVVKLIGQKLSSETSFNYNMLNVEESFRAAGWKVRYDTPGYNEDYEAFFEFIGS